MRTATTSDRDSLLDDDLLNQGVGSLSNALWEQRVRLHDLLHRAKVAQLVMAGDDRRWLDRAIGELESSVRGLRADDHVPARLLGAIARHLGRADIETIRDLAALLPAPWAETLDEHASGMADSLTRLTAIERENRQLAISGLGNIRAMVALLAPERDRGDSYDASGRRVTSDNANVDRLM